MKLSQLLREKIGNYNQKIIYNLIKFHYHELKLSKLVISALKQSYYLYFDDPTTSTIKNEIERYKKKRIQRKSRVFLLERKTFQHLDLIEFIKPCNTRCLRKVLYYHCNRQCILDFFICIRKGKCILLSPGETRYYDNLTYIETRYSNFISEIEDTTVYFDMKTYQTIMYYLEPNISKKMITNQSLAKYGWSSDFRPKLIDLTQQEAIDLYYS